MIVFDFGAEKKQATYADYLKTPEGGKFHSTGELSKTETAKSRLLPEMEVELLGIF